MVREIGDLDSLTLTVGPREEADAKMRELILYISRECDGDPTFGATKLNKILFWSDFLAFGFFGKPITGAEYRAREFGPAPLRLSVVRDELIGNGELVFHEEVAGKGAVRKRPIALREPDLSFLSASEISLIDHQIKDLWGKSAKEISRESHGLAWDTTPRDEAIAYEKIFISNRPPSHSAYVWAGRVAAKLNLNA